MQVDDSIAASISKSKPAMTSFVLLIAGIAAIAGILFGFDTGVISGAILFIKQQYQLSAFYNGVVVSAVLFGALFGSAMSGRFADLFGRRLLLVLTALIFLLSTIGCALANSVGLLIVMRLLVGVAIGIASFTTPLYISEIAPPKARGALVSLNQLAVTIGILLAYMVDSFFAPTGSWRWMFAMGIIPALMLLLGMLFLPQSPRWIVLKGRIAHAREILKKFGPVIL